MINNSFNVAENPEGGVLIVIDNKDMVTKTVDDSSDGNHWHNVTSCTHGVAEGDVVSLLPQRVEECNWVIRNAQPFPVLTWMHRQWDRGLEKDRRANTILSAEVVVKNCR
jgi:hypothetical protein